jgi:RNA polymerase sigma-70 factor (ECF subfamily)
LPLEFPENRSQSTAPKLISAAEIAAMTRRMADADEEAFRMFHALYFNRLARYLLVVARGDEQLMRDALQETFRRVAKHVRVFSEESVFWSWLTTLARSSLSDERRTGRRYLAFLERFTRHASIPAESTRDEADVLNECLHQHLAVLDPRDRELVEWKYFDAIPVREIAARCQTTEAAVESRLVRIRRKLKNAILAELRNESVS